MKFELCILLLAAAASAIPDASLCVEKVPEGEDPAKYHVCRENPRGHDSPVAAQMVQVARAQTAEEIAVECGSLGVMEVPEGEDPSKYRKCRDHPLGHAAARLEHGPASKRKIDASPAHFLERRRVADLEKRACWWGPYWFGCSDGSCWTSCGANYQQTGAWCWLAVNNGNGEWAKCSSNNQCNVGGLACGGGCSC